MAILQMIRKKMCNIRRVVYNIKENKYYVYHDKCIKDLSNIVGTEDKEKIEIREDFHYQCHKCNKNYMI